MDAILSRLLSARNLDGGWGYAPGRDSRIEPTAWMSMALADKPERGPALDWLERALDSKNRATSTPSTPDSEWGTSLVALALMSPRPARALPVVQHVLTQHARIVSPPLPINPTGDQLAWGWMNSAFSWMEPTTFGVWVLTRAKAAGLLKDQAQAELRLEQARRVLLSRRCKDGGWNHGCTFGSEYQMESFPVSTALGLLALWALGERTDALQTWPLAVRRVTEEPSALANAWLIIAGKVLGRPVGGFEDRLRLGWDRLATQQHFVGALALLALGEGWRAWA